MTTRISLDQFRAATGVADWTPSGDGEVGVVYATGSFARGVDLIVRIGTIADAADHHPDVDLRYSSVAVRLTTHEVGGLTERDVLVAQEIALAARDLGVEPGPSA